MRAISTLPITRVAPGIHAAPTTRSPGFCGFRPRSRSAPACMRRSCAVVAGGAGCSEVQGRDGTIAPLKYSGKPVFALVRGASDVAAVRNDELFVRQAHPGF